MMAYYQNLYHGENTPVDSNSGDLSGETSSAFSLADSSLTGYTLTRDYVGPPKNPGTAYYLTPSNASIGGPYDSYLVALTLASTSGNRSVKMAFVVSAYYQNQIP